MASRTAGGKTTLHATPFRSILGVAVAAAIAVTCPSCREQAPVETKEVKPADAEDQSLEKRIAQNPGDIEARLALAFSYVEKGNHEEARAQFEKALELDSDRIDAHFGLGRVLLGQGKLDEAKALFEKVIAAAPEKPTERQMAALSGAHYYLGRILQDEDALVKAIEHYEAAIHNYLRKPRQPTPGTIHRRLALMHHWLGDVGKAVKHYRQAVKKDSDLSVPLRITMLNDLAWLLATDQKHRDPTAAVSYARQAVGATDNSDPALLDTLAVAQASAGKFDEAVKTAEKAVELAAAAKKADLAAVIRSHLELFKQRKPYEGK